jgi:hypothetical protein
VWGIGIKRAVKHIHTLKSMNNVVAHLREVKPYSERVPDNYEKEIMDSKLIFLFATTYNPFTNCLEYLNSSRLNEFLPSISEEELQKIVGRRYDYSEDVRMGRVNLKNLEKREIHAIEFKTIFSLNANNLQAKELDNHQRRLAEASAKLRREEEKRAMAESGNIDSIVHTQ